VVRDLCLTLTTLFFLCLLESKEQSVSEKPGMVLAAVLVIGFQSSTVYIGFLLLKVTVANFQL